ncbi:expressed unknown protein [Seminavis robusta]|uniref:PDZ domain-containing protein n=1 Tax=Seminavis robusta TaxID=568900 RepID=A0A9N8DHD5_9STRA|nr:expressed unknown protein [Seminavis robusta]|eukprot:Sro143_g066780.1 n/a (1110) ;mRNA; f:94186-97794
MMSPSRETNRRWPLIPLVLVLLFLAAVPSKADSSASYLRQPRQRKLQLTTTEYNVLLHLSLDYANDAFAAAFADRNSDTVKYFCSAVNLQAGGNQVQQIAELNGLSIETRILGLFSQPDYQCTIVDSARTLDSDMDSSGQLYSYGVTVEQVVYVTANRTLPLAGVTSMVESGFNRGSGGRVRFRSLLRDHTMFATVQNVEVVEGPLTKHPTPIPTPRPSPMPTGTPSVAPTADPSQTPTLRPTIFRTDPPTSPPVEITPSPTTLPPTEHPSNDEMPSAFTPAPLLHGTDKDPDSNASMDPVTIAVIVAGTLMILIAACCLFYLWYMYRATEEDDKRKADGASLSWLRRNLSPLMDDNDDSVPNVGTVPNMVQLDDDNRSLANTTLGDQTAGGGARRRQQQQQHQESLNKNKKEGNQDSGPQENGRILNSFDDNSLYTSHQSVPAPPSQDPADETAKESIGGSFFEASSNSVMLPPSIMPYEEDSIVFPIQDFESDTTSLESGAVQSSILSSSFASSSLSPTNINRGPVDIDAVESSSQEEDLFGTDPFTVVSPNDVVVPRKKKKLVVIENSKLATQGKSSKDRRETESSHFSLFDSSDKNLLNHLKLGAEQPPSGGNSSFRSEADVEPSVASSTSSLTKKAENLFMFGFRSPPEEHKSELSSSTATPNEEEKREIECETRDDEKSDDIFFADFESGNREEGKVSFPIDLLADNQQLERSASPASWASWKLPEEPRPKQPDEEESKIAPRDDQESGDSSETRPVRNQFLGASATVTAAGFRRFIPIEDGETKEASPTPKQSNAGRLQEKLASPREDDAIHPASTELSSPAADDGTGILGVQPRKEADALVEIRSVSSSSTGMSNPWLFETVEKALGPRSVTADMESLSGRSHRSGKSHRSRSSHHSHRSHKSNRSYNVPSGSKYRGRGDGRIRSAAASVASYGGSSAFERKSGDADKPLEPRHSLEHDLNRLEMQLAALQTETDQVTASSITLSSVGAKTRSTRSSKLTHTGNKIIRKRRVIVEVPPGKLGVILANRHDGRGTVVSEVRPDSSLKGMLSPGDKLVAIDGEDVQGFSVNEITEIMTKKHNMERLLTVITSMHQETKSVGTL